MDEVKTKTSYFPTLANVEAAAENLKGMVSISPLMKNLQYSNRFESDIFFKREDFQVVRSYKIRGAYHKMSSLNILETKKGIVCASAGNHAQGVALSCKLLKIKGTIYMPLSTPNQKIEQVKMFGEEFVEIVMEGDTYDDACLAAKLNCELTHRTFVHPFDDKKLLKAKQQ